MELVSLNYLEKLTGVKRQTISKYLEGLPFKPGPKQAKLYNSEEALPVIFLGDGSSLSGQKERARLDHHRADIEEMKAKQMRRELAPISDVVAVIQDQIAAARAKFLALPVRVAQSLPVEPKVKREAEHLMRKEIYAALDELSTRDYGE